MKNSEFKDLITQHIWFVYTNGKIGTEWELPKNYPKTQIAGFTQTQSYILGLVMGQLYVRKEDDNFIKIYHNTKQTEQVSHIIINAIAKIPWDIVEWEPNEETKQAMRDARAGKDLKKFATIEELFEDLHIDEE